MKYHENLLGEAASHRDRYDEVAEMMGCFASDQRSRLKQQPLQQVWRDHLLGGVLRHVGGYDDGFFLLLYPQDNPHCRAAVDAYRSCLSCADTFASLTLEALVAEIMRHTSKDWVGRVTDRYLAFGKIDALLGKPVSVT